jgi:hypothetical protein
MRHLVTTLILLSYGTPEEDAAAAAAAAAAAKPKTFSQDDVNALIAQERRTLEGRSKTLLGELEALKTKSSLTAQEKADLESRLEETRNALMTKEELAREALLKEKKQRESEVTNLSSERDAWRNRFASSTIHRSITDAAVALDSYNPSQIVAILASNTRVVEATGEDGKPTGEFNVQVTMQDVGKDGKPIKLDLSVQDAVKRLKEKSEFHNLFKGLGTGGTGNGNKGGGSGSTNIEELAKDPAAYRAARKAGKI